MIGASAAAHAADKPNILVIWGDDIRQSNLSAYTFGLMGYRTPNIDSIAKERLLRRAWKALRKSWRWYQLPRALPQLADRKREADIDLKSE
jgi:hypothetical protein